MSFLYSIASPELAKSPVQWLPESLSPSVKLEVRETVHSPQLNGAATPHTYSWHGAYWFEYRDDFTLS